MKITQVKIKPQGVIVEMLVGYFPKGPSAGSHDKCRHACQYKAGAYRILSPVLCTPNGVLYITLEIKILDQGETIADR